MRKQWESSEKKLINVKIWVRENEFSLAVKPSLYCYLQKLRSRSQIASRSRFLEILVPVLEAKFWVQKTALTPLWSFKNDSFHSNSWTSIKLIFLDFIFSFMIFWIWISSGYLKMLKKILTELELTAAEGLVLRFIWKTMVTELSLMQQLRNQLQKKMQLQSRLPGAGAEFLSRVYIWTQTAHAEARWGRMYRTFCTRFGICRGIE